MAAQLVGVRVGDPLTAGARFRATWGARGLADSVGLGVDMARVARTLWDTAVVAAGIAYPISQPLVDAASRAVVLDVKVQHASAGRPAGELVRALETAGNRAVPGGALFDVRGVTDVALIRLEKIGAESSAQAVTARADAVDVATQLTRDSSTAAAIGNAAGAAVSGITRTVMIGLVVVAVVLVVTGRAKGALDWT